jgi:hypothetical protein
VIFLDEVVFWAGHLETFAVVGWCGRYFQWCRSVGCLVGCLADWLGRIAVDWLADYLAGCSERSAGRLVPHYFADWQRRCADCCLYSWGWERFFRRWVY